MLILMMNPVAFYLSPLSKLVKANAASVGVNNLEE
jgi:hypothetical protein